MGRKTQHTYITFLRKDIFQKYIPIGGSGEKGRTVSKESREKDCESCGRKIKLSEAQLGLGEFATLGRGPVGCFRARASRSGRPKASHQGLGVPGALRLRQQGTADVSLRRSGWRGACRGACGRAEVRGEVAVADAAE